MGAWYEDEEGEKRDKSPYSPKQEDEVPSGSVLQGTNDSEKQRVAIQQNSVEGERNQTSHIPDPAAPAVKKAEVTPALHLQDKLDQSTPMNPGGNGGERLDEVTVAGPARMAAIVKDAANAQVDANTAYADTMRGNREDVSRAEDEYVKSVNARNAAIKEQLAKTDQKVNELATKQVSEGHFWKNPFNVLAALAQSLTPLGSGRIDGRANINAMIQRDLDEQKQEYENAKGTIGEMRTSIGQYRQLAGDAEVGDKMLLAKKYEIAASKLQELAVRSQNPQVIANAKMEGEKLLRDASLLRMQISEHTYRNPQIDKPGVGAMYQRGQTQVIGGVPKSTNKDVVAELAQQVSKSWQDKFGRPPPPEVLDVLVKAAMKNLPAPPKSNNLAQTEAEAKAMERPDVISGAGAAVPQEAPVRTINAKEQVITDEPAPDASQDPDVQSAGAVLQDTLESPLSKAAKAIGARVPAQVAAAASAGDAAKVINSPVVKIGGKQNVSLKDPVVISDNEPGTRPMTGFQRGPGTVEGTDQTPEDRNADVVKQLRAEANASTKTKEDLNKAIAHLHEEQAIARATGKTWKYGQPVPAMTPAQVKAAREYAAELDAKGREETAKITSELAQAKVLDAEEDHRVLRMMQATLLKRYGSMEAVDKKMGVLRALPKPLSPGGRPTWESEKKLRDAWDAQFGGPDTEEGRRHKAEMDQIYDYMMYVRKTAAKYKIERTGAAANEKEMVEINTDFSPEQSFRDQINAVGQLDSSRQNVYNHILGGHSSSAQGLLNSRFQNKATSPVDRPNQLVPGSK